MLFKKVMTVISNQWVGFKEIVKNIQKYMKSCCFDDLRLKIACFFCFFGKAHHLLALIKCRIPFKQQ